MDDLTLAAIAAVLTTSAVLISMLWLARFAQKSPGEMPRKASQGAATLLQAAEMGDTHTLRQELQLRPQLREACNSRGETALIVAARLGHVSACKLLVSLRADVEATDSASGTPLAYAAKGKHAEICQLLLEHGADIESVDCGVRSAGCVLQ
ncbi:unnamed protein product [Cladocopium goreaui]|uniref:Ankyrin-1 n=2 Tax=Cladocopium goreaui TaxID=2562237 RepID=A0A9P1CAR2_9DINO|nr:unnamed protein product [Cladocopium goreaui]